MLSRIVENFDRGTHAVIAQVLCVQYSVAEHGRQMEAILTMRLRQATETLKAPEKTIEYEVVGLPPRHEARIALFDDRWKIIHIDNGTRVSGLAPMRVLRRLWPRCRRRVKKTNFDGPTKNQERLFSANPVTTVCPVANCRSAASRVCIVT
jgi:hypothetical protein